ncbi:MAG: twin-arginine translocase TatA/TatE family subunit [Deltaproteobacteria bacterium]|nr:twin-arginine translocase TatA/TatE family subunit [Deltaproteobacteria bacterium]
MHLGFYELLVILAIVVLLFGGTKLPQLGQALGRAVKGLKSGLKGGDEIVAGDEKKGLGGEKKA